MKNIRYLRWSFSILRLPPFPSKIKKIKWMQSSKDLVYGIVTEGNCIIFNTFLMYKNKVMVILLMEPLGLNFLIISVEVFFFPPMTMYPLCQQNELLSISKHTKTLQQFMMHELLRNTITQMNLTDIISSARNQI